MNSPRMKNAPHNSRVIVDLTEKSVCIYFDDNKHWLEQTAENYRFYFIAEAQQTLTHTQTPLSIWLQFKIFFAASSHNQTVEQVEEK